MSDDLIKRSDAIKALYKYSFVSKGIIEKEIRAIPTADRPRGEWIPKYEGSYLQRRMYCSVCGKRSGIGGIESNQRKPFCPNCGADMRGESDGE